MIPNLLPLKPYLRETVWGGRSLGTHYNKALPPNVPIGESWEVSAYKGMESIVADGPLAGQNLADLVAIYGADILGQRVIQRYGTEFPLLIKLLDARDDLSIQVHPDDTYTRAENLGTYGKTEAWYILKSNHGRVACGLKDGVDKHNLESSIRENRVQDTVQFFDVQEGDVIFVPPGTVHALCQNVMIYEVQQSSDLTFRIYDYNRPGTDGKPRELHIDRALDVIAFDAPAPEPQHWRHLATDSNATLIGAKDTEYFRLERFAPAGTVQHTYPTFAALTVLTGRAQLNKTYTAQTGDTFFIPANRTVTVSPEEQVEYLISSCG